ncbi:class I SAM-dependent DNA methyltransferase [Desulfonema ishimotonii]|uniref:site-specific DNA-methyltransferase (adenine-specific) n=1 Tax=Desulfonema ishimotonii TaxID=45657 RepID=A0A401FZ43_9BACT|nr:DNA methyltransferase [Desulfonema ishimotonii]GBC62262.1 class I SAM-dependent DNA methyltransferase [Desulfonema ishimotonii]
MQARHPNGDIRQKKGSKQQMIERISRNEIRRRAHRFVKSWENAKNERSESQSFWNSFFHVFGKDRREVGEFERAVKKLGERQGFIDLFWPGQLVVEQKSAGKDLEKAADQAFDYLSGLKKHEKPRYVLVSDFQNFVLHDLEERAEHAFRLAELPDRLELFDFIAGYDTRIHTGEDPANIEAAERMGKLHDALAESGYTGHDLELFLVRILFCVFAEDSGIFQQDHGFEDYLRDETREDGSDLGPQLAQIFQVLNTPESRRSKNLNTLLQTFPYVNGRLFADFSPMPSFDSGMRKALLECCAFDWKEISPEIFGALFQSIMNREKRRNLGAHYTSERNILKLIHPLFLDELWRELGRAGKNGRKLEAFHDKLAGLKFLDPACGCGNFLIVTYRELRKLEMEVLRRLNPRKKQRQLSIDVLNDMAKVNVDQFYGIETEEFPARIAEVAMWLTDHQMNRALSAEFGAYYVRIPLTHAATICHGNALETDWQSLVAPEDLFCILGNPPFRGSKWQNATQRKEMKTIFAGVRGAGVLDYVSAWYLRAAQYIQGTRICCAFVSTNSVSQGEQAGILWKPLLEEYGVRIHFAHRTFQWTSEARGKAAVFCVIIGFAAYDAENKWLFEYETPRTELPERQRAGNINPYLVNSPDVTIERRSKPLCDVPGMFTGNKPIDDGNYLFTIEEKEAFLEHEPHAAPYFRRWMDGKGFINNRPRWCLWLGQCAPHMLKKMPESLKRIEAVRRFRQNSKSKPTQKLSETPTRFHIETMPEGNSIVVPQVSSERRLYMPIGFIGPETLCSDKIKLIPDATLYHFGVLTSMMHMEWMRYTAGRLKSDYNYSNTLVYNNFPWPEKLNGKQTQKVETAARSVLDARAQFPESSLADLYDPLTMPPVLLRAHQNLDRAVDTCYGKRKFTSERERVEFLFQRYEKLKRSER